MEVPNTTRAFFGNGNHTSVLELRGPVRFVAARALRTFFDNAIAWSDTDTVIIDLRGVDLIDSTGLGLLARIGRASLESVGRRAVIICGDNDVAACLRSAAFDKLFVMIEEYPFDERVPLVEVPLNLPDAAHPDRSLGRLILDAHRDLASVSDGNRGAYGEIIAALEADLQRRTSRPTANAR